MLTKDQQTQTTPEAALARLVAGNTRFVAGSAEARDLMAEVKTTAGGQHPVAVVLSCIDSRVSAELVFDQGVGDIFSARVAGNVLNGDILGSMEFACQLAGAKLIVVLGHTACGAVKGACAGAELGHLTGLLEKIAPSVSAAEAMPDLADADRVDTVARLNVAHVAEAIVAESAVLRDLVKAGTVQVVGAMYDVATGAVAFDA